jgi:hypothetical protein
MGPGDIRDAQPWEVSFVAVSAIAGEPPDAVASALGDAGVQRAEALVAALAPGGATSSKEARARVLARALSDVVLALDAMRYA